MRNRATKKSPTSKERKHTLAVADEEEIRRRAYELYLERGESPGDPAEDWLKAQRQISARRKGRK
jgi:hypothetical protein